MSTNARVISEYFTHSLKYLQGNVVFLPAGEQLVQIEYIYILHPPWPVSLFRLFSSTFRLKGRTQRMLLPIQKWVTQPQIQREKEKVNYY